MSIERMIQKIQINSQYQEPVNAAIKNLKDVIQHMKETGDYERSVTLKSADVAVDHIEKIREALDIAVAVVDMMHNSAFTPADMVMGIEAFNTALIRAKVSRLETDRN